MYKCTYTCVHMYSLYTLYLYIYIIAIIYEYRNTMLEYCY